MGNFNDLNFIEMLRRDLESIIKKELTEELVRAEVEAFEATLIDRVKPLVESIVFAKIDNFHDLMNMRNEIKLYLKWDGEDIKLLEGES